MSAIFILVPLSIVFATAFLIAFIWAVRSGQFDDTCTPSMRVLCDEAKQVSSPVKCEHDVSLHPVPLRKKETVPDSGQSCELQEFDALRAGSPAVRSADTLVRSASPGLTTDKAAYASESFS